MIYHPDTTHSHAKIKRLTTRNASSVKQYNSDLWEKLRGHKIPEKWNVLSAEITSSGICPSEQHRAQAEQLHTEMLEHQLGAERTCQKILKTESEFSLPIKFCYDTIHAYQGLIKLLKRDNILKWVEAGSTGSQGTMTFLTLNI